MIILYIHEYEELFTYTVYEKMLEYLATSLLLLHFISNSFNIAAADRRRLARYHYKNTCTLQHRRRRRLTDCRRLSRHCYKTYTRCNIADIAESLTVAGSLTVADYVTVADSLTDADYLTVAD